MDSSENAHPNQHDLLLFVDGEMPPEAADHIKSHLEACWSCRLKTDQLQEAILSVADFCDSVLTPAAGPPPRGWRTFYAKLRATVAAAGRESVRSRLQRALLSWRVLMSLAATGAMCLMLYWLGRPPVASASELLGRAQQSRSNSLRAVRQPVVYQKLRIEVGGRSVTREVWRDTVHDRVKDTWDIAGDRSAHSVTTTGPVDEADLPNLFTANHLIWSDPLSPAGYAQWRAAAGTVTDEVVRHGSSELTVKTSTVGQTENDPTVGRSMGRIVSASMTVRAHDFHPVFERFQVEFKTGASHTERAIELSELDYAVVTFDALSPALFSPESPVDLSSAAGLTVTPPRTLAPGPSPAELVDDEMAARFALHQIGADLGEQIEIQRDVARRKPQIIVSGLLESGDRKRQLLSALEEIPHLEVDLETPEEAARNRKKSPPAPSASAGDTEQVVSTQSAIEKQLLEYFGSSANVEAFSRQAFSIAEALMAEAWALRHLDERYPEADRADLSAPSRQLLELMIRDHRRALGQRTKELNGLLDPLLSGIAAPVATSAANEKPLLSTFANAQQIESLTLGLLAGSEPASRPSDQAGSVELSAVMSARAARDLMTALQDLTTQLGDAE